MSNLQILLPNQSSMKFKLPEDSTPWRDWIKVERASVANSKRGCPILMNNPVSNYQVVFVDFDGLDNAMVVRTLVTESTIIPAIFTSVSGNVKAAFLVRFKGLPTAEDKMDFLKEVLPESLVPCVDRMGLEKCFVNSSTLAVLKDQLDISPICSWTCGQHRDIQYTRKSFSYFSDKVLDERLERYLPQFKDQILAREVLQVLQTTFNLAGEGFGISTTVLSRQLGVNHKFISETLKRLTELNLIECVDSSYMKGKKAKTYKAKWALKTVIVEKIAAHKKEAKALPVSCVAGQTYKSFLSALWRFDSAENFVKWAMTLPGIHLKGRLGMARSMARSHFKRVA